MKKMSLVFLFGFLAFVILRAAALFVIPPLDDGVVLLQMADDIAHLRRFPIYFDQQEYMGAIECYFLAPFVRVFGSNFWALEAAYGLFYLAFFALCVWTAQRVFRGRLTLYVFLLLAILPFPALFFTTVIGYGEVLTFAMVSLVFLLRIMRKEEGGGGSAFFLGLVAGLSLWSNLIYVVWLLPLVGLLVFMAPNSWRRGLPFLFSLGLLIGLVPVWIHGIQTGRLMDISQGAGRGFASPENLLRLFYLFFARMKYFLSSFSFGNLPPAADLLFRLVSFFPFLVFAFSFLSLLFYFFRSGRQIPLEEKAFYIFILVPPFVLLPLCISRNLIGDEGMRFFLPLLIPFVFAVAWQLARIRASFWRRGVLGGLLLIFLAGSVYSARHELQETRERRELIQFLREHRLQAGIAEFGITYSLNVLSGGELLVTPPWYNAAYRPVLHRVREAGPRFFILGRGTVRFRKRLEADPRLQVAAVGRYDIFYGNSDLLRQFVTPGELMEE